MNQVVTVQQIGGVRAANRVVKRITRRDRFLAVMQQVVPWDRLAEAAEPHWPRPREGARVRVTVALPCMLRLYFVQQWYALADDALEDALHDSVALRRFVGIDLATESVPCASTVLEFRRLLHGQSLLRTLLVEIDNHLRCQGLLMKPGSMSEAAIVAVDNAVRARCA
jgi:IS5 family transposase